MDTERLKALWEGSGDKYGDARRIGTTYQTMYNIVYRGMTFKVELLERIAAYYGKPVGYFFDEVDGSGRSEAERQIAHLEGRVEALQDALRLLGKL